MLARDRWDLEVGYLSRAHPYLQKGSRFQIKIKVIYSNCAWQQRFASLLSPMAAVCGKSIFMPRCFGFFLRFDVLLIFGMTGARDHNGRQE